MDEPENTSEPDTKDHVCMTALTGNVENRHRQGDRKWVSGGQGLGQGEGGERLLPETGFSVGDDVFWH